MAGRSVISNWCDSFSVQLCVWHDDGVCRLGLAHIFFFIESPDDSASYIKPHVYLAQLGLFSVRKRGIQETNPIN